MNDLTDKGKLLDQLKIDRQAEEPPSRVPWIVGAIVLLVALGGAALWYFLSTNKGFEVETVTTAPPSAQSGGAGTAVLQATGYVTARRQATVSAQITGTLTQVLIEEGERVQQGQVLARLEETAQRARLDEAIAQLGQARAQVGQFESQLGQARRDYVRQQELVQRRLVSQQAEESARTQVDALESQLATQRRGVQLAEAQVRSARVQLDYCTVRAPFTGVVIAKAAQVGEIVSPLSAGGGFTRTGIGTIVDMDSLEIEVDVNESYINRVKTNAPAQAVLDAYQDWQIPARVIAIIPTADRGKATVKVRVGLEQKDPRILPDMGARVSFLEGEAAASANGAPPKGVLVPGSAIVSLEGQSKVFVVNGDLARAQTVTPGPSFGDLRLIEGVPAGVQVIREPPEALTDGARVEVKK